MKQNLTKVKEEMDKSLIIVGDAKTIPQRLIVKKSKGCGRIQQYQPTDSNRHY